MTPPSQGEQHLTTPLLSIQSCLQKMMSICWIKDPAAILEEAVFSLSVCALVYTLWKMIGQIFVSSVGIQLYSVSSNNSVVVLC